LSSEAADQISDGIAVLSNGEARKLDARRLVALLGGLGVKSLMDVGGDFASILGAAFLLGVFGHCLGDQLGKLLDGTRADQRLGIFLVRALAVFAVTGGALLLENLFACPLLRCFTAGRTDR